ncbi:PTS sugar transporter subunit IIB [Enterococcus hulanensis]|uniref:PTS sugar transporter subunit IIB n=1 Tax=Enterococcus hulanensis TaxID=2559929 RepID=UPI001A8F95E9|nr:PTS sugar transporter subunit IIB [Enterococcus hulanensis]MBO0455263.1 PTS sugar transporter subunit IIB [Enterococcus hulanensis]MDT2660050.1 PTS sugar transporter subunit IIB [Enterococcus hulanensis]
MIKIITVCGNGIGSSNLLAMKINQIAKKNGISVDATPSDFNAALGEEPDLFVTVDEFAKQFPATKKVAVVRSYADRKKITEDILPLLEELNKE